MTEARSSESLRCQCPYCGERIVLVVDPASAGDFYIEDCEVCCRPMRVNVDLDEDGRLSVRLHDENET